MFMAKLLGDFVGLFLYMICIFICWTFVSNVQGEASCRKSDMDALLSLKTGFQDPYNMLRSWNGSNCCEWSGIGCDNVSLSVTSIDLRGYGVSGDISSSLTKLESLTYLNLSDNSFNDSPIPEFFGSLSNLRYLDLSDAGFGGMLTPRLGNLSNLEYLDLSATYSSSLAVASLEWLTGFRYLKHLSFDWVDMSKIGSNWLEDINKLSQLKVLRMSNCRLTGSISSLSTVNLTSLSLIDFSSNDFFSKLPNWILNISSIVHIKMDEASLYGRIPLGLAELPNLEHLYLGYNSNLSASSYSLLKGSWPSIKNLHLPDIKLHGKLPSNIGNMTTLVELYLRSNKIQGSIPSSIGKLCNLRMLVVSFNNLTENLPEYLSSADGSSFGSPLPNLRYLHLDYNKLKGNLPTWLGQLANLERLSLSHNSFQGLIPSSFGALARLEFIDLSNNKLTGTVFGTIGQLSKLNTLKLSSNHLSFNVGTNWLPSFQLSSLDLRSCMLDTTFPTWVKSQKQLTKLDLSNNNISGIVPSWFWDDIAANLYLLNISFNHLRGHLPNPLPSREFAYIDLSSNLFDGPIPLPTVEINLFFLSNNNFTGHISANIGEKQSRMVFISLSNNVLSGEIPTSIGLMSKLQLLDLSNNMLSGTIPSNISNCAYLKILDLSNNNLSGSIPTGVWNSSFFSSMHLNNNRLSGSIPTNLQSLSNLKILDLSHNDLSCEIPSWLGQHFKDLQILNLRSNNFYGNIPPTISNLSLLHALDLAENKLTGNIPSTFSNLLGMSQPQMMDLGFIIPPYLPINISLMQLLSLFYDTYYQDSETMIIKSIIQKYTKTLYLLTSIDLSCNRFSGPFPDGITNLSTLKMLNLSRNEIHGRIPESISRMRALESLDFSCNNLFGAIPTSISSLTFLGAFNVSNNNLSGKIPLSTQISTFNQSSFEGNPELCGPPLTIQCTGEQPSSKDDEAVNGDHHENGLFYMSVGVGFGVGILFPVLLFAIKESWRIEYFKFVDMMIRCLINS